MSNIITVKRSNVEGKIPTIQQLLAGELAMNTNDKALYFSTGSDIIQLANRSDIPLTSSGLVTDSLSFSGEANKGLLVNNLFSWKDLEGDVTPKDTGSTVTLRNFIGNIKGWTHTTHSVGELRYHIPHDYALGTNLFIHVHWGHNGTAISGNFAVKLEMTYAPRTIVTSAFHTPKFITMTTEALNITNSPIYCHRVDEVQVSTVGGSTTMLDSSAISVDGLIMIHYDIMSIPTISGSAETNNPYIFTIDMHMQSTGIGTVSKDPGFYI